MPASHQPIPAIQSRIVDQFIRSIYVDDVIYGSSDIDKAYRLYLWSKTKVAEGGRLQKFVTNSPVLRQRIEENELLSEKMPVLDLVEAVSGDQHMLSILKKLISQPTQTRRHR